MIFEPIAIFGVIGTLVIHIEDAIPIAIAFVSFRTTVLVGIAIPILGNHRTFIVHVEDAIAIVIRIGAAIFIPEVIEVLGFIGTLIDIVAEPIPIAIADRRLEDEADHAARIALQHAADRNAATPRQHEVAVPLDEDLEAQHALERMASTTGHRRKDGRPIDIGGELDG